MAMVGGAYLRNKRTCARTSTENVGGAYTRRGAYMRDATVCLLLFTSLTEEQLITIFPGEAIVVGWFDQASCDIGTDSFVPK